MTLLLAALAACAVDGQTDSAAIPPGAVFGSSEGECPIGGLGIEVDVGSDVAVVTGDACPVDNMRCEPILLRRSDGPGSSRWYGYCEEGWLYSIAWVVPG